MTDAANSGWASDNVSARKRLFFVLSTVGLLVALNVIASIYSLGWKSVTANTAFILALFVGFIFRHKDRVLLGWLIFGLVAGVGELVADWWLVNTGTLVYPQDEPIIWVSPAYMPFAWTMVLLQIGGLASWFVERFSVPVAGVLTAVAAGVNIPIYEHLAKGADWWYYKETPMLFDAPYYVIFAEFLLAVPLAWFAKRVTEGPLSRAAVLGAVEAVVMFVASVIAFKVLGPCVGALIQFSCS